MNDGKDFPYARKDCDLLQVLAPGHFEFLVTQTSDHRFVMEELWERLPLRLGTLLAIPLHRWHVQGCCID